MPCYLEFRSSVPYTILAMVAVRSGSGSFGSHLSGRLLVSKLLEGRANDPPKFNPDRTWSGVAIAMICRGRVFR